MRLAVVLSHPTQYYSPWFRWLAQNTPLTLRVFYLWDAGVTERRDPRFGTLVRWDTDLLSGYESRFVPNHSRHPHTDTFGGLVNPGLLPTLEAWHPDALLLFGYRFVTHLAVISWARLRGIPLLFRGDSHHLGRPTLPLATRLSLRLLYRQFDAFASVGRANHDYFRTLGVPSSRIFHVPHAVDACHFRDPDGRHAAAAAGLRHSLGIPPGHRVLLFSGKFHGGKNPLGLLEAFAALAPRDWSLVLAGDGEDAGLLRRRAAQVSNSSIHFLPFANQGAMPARYLLGDLFCLPSLGYHETWGLAVNEAMHMGRPCLVSDRVGCQRDLVLPGRTGFVFKASEPDSIRETLTQAMKAPLIEMGRAAALHVAAYSYANAASGLCRALAGLPGWKSLPAE
jgi:glycosyltransferase involved in cell wall biosynthesis